MNGLLASVAGVTVLVAAALAPQPWQDSEAKSASTSPKPSSSAVGTSTITYVDSEGKKTAVVPPGVMSAPVSMSNMSQFGGFGQSSGPGYFFSRNDAMDEATIKLIREEAELQGKIHESVAVFMKAKDDDKARSAAKDAIQQSLERQFVIHVERQEKEIKKVEAKLKELKDLLDKRINAKRKIVERRLDQILEEAEGLGWQGGSSKVEHDMLKQRILGEYLYGVQSPISTYFRWGAVPKQSDQAPAKN